MPPFYDDGESFTAGDDDPGTRHFNNDQLMALFVAIRAIFLDEETRTLFRLAILRAIYGEAEDI
jgi:hypothetical protein